MPVASATSPLRFVVLLAIAAAMPPVVLILLRTFEVPIGQPFFLVYRYSPFVGLRLTSAMPAFLIGFAGVYAFHRAMSLEGRGRRIGLGFAFAAYALVVVWTFFAPPHFVAQHTFNLMSPSHEGAFVLEARHVTSVRDYVSRTFPERLHRSAEEMRGRRVISNPPGMTVAAYATRRTVERIPALKRSLVQAFELEEIEEPQIRTEFAAAMLLGILMTIAWAAAIVPAYRLANIWLPQGAAAAVAFACVFNPATAGFTPGKDPAQLFTVLLGLMCSIQSYRQRRALPGFAAGAILAAASMIGLIHVWTFAIAFAATMIHSITKGPGIGIWWRRCAFPSLAGGVAVCSLAYLTLDWNLPLTLAQVARRYGEIQVPIITDPFYWTLVGLPMFLLFVGTLFWAQLIAVRERRDDDPARIGRLVLVTTLAVMTYTYFFANNNETPRLWIPFVPLLLWSMALLRSRFREATPANARLWTVLLALQLAATLVQWSLMDMREAEWRLSTGKMWD
jgi:hypothetical protein